MQITRGCAFVAAALACSSAAFAAGSYTATSIPVLEGGVGSLGYGVNENGWVVGQADQNGVRVGFVYHDGQTFALPLLPGGSDGLATSINSNNVICGECKNSSSVSRPVRWEMDSNGDWQITDLGTLAGGAGFGTATRINEGGQIVGYSTIVSGGRYEGFLWTAGSMTNIGTLGFAGNFAYSQALGINGLGDVSGFAYATLQGPEHGLFKAIDGRGMDVTPPGQFGLAQWSNVNDSRVLGGYVSGTLTSGAFRPAIWDAENGIQLLPLIDTIPEGYGYDINNDSSVVGTMFLLDPDPTLSIFLAFLSENGATSDLNTISTGLPGTLTEARDISNSGFIVGTADGPNGPVAVLLTPGAGCTADFNGDNQVDFFDYLDFAQAFDSEDPAADFNGDNQIDFFDYLDFAQAFDVGCE
jgi:probable HAF family extracellular repeat protein